MLLCVLSRITKFISINPLIRVNECSEVKFAKAKRNSLLVEFLFNSDGLIWYTIKSLKSSYWRFFFGSSIGNFCELNFSGSEFVVYLFGLAEFEFSGSDVVLCSVWPSELEFSDSDAVVCSVWLYEFEFSFFFGLAEQIKRFVFSKITW